jgi:hypothetical protein
MSFPVNGSLIVEEMAPAGSSSPQMNVFLTSALKTGTSAWQSAGKLNISAKHKHEVRLFIGSRSSIAKDACLFGDSPLANLQNHLWEISAPRLFFFQWTKCGQQTRLSYASQDFSFGHTTFPCLVIG